MQETLDLAVVGAGPCGIAVGTAAAKEGLEAILLEKGCITNSLLSYPYYLTFFSTARMLEIGGVPFTIPNSKPTRKEALAYYRRVVEHWSLVIRQHEPVVEITGASGEFRLSTEARDGSRRHYHARAVVVATGGFDEPNYLGVPGEDLLKVSHYYREPYPYFDQDVLVIGAGNSAVESALELFRNGARVTLVHVFGGIDSGVKPWVVPDITNRLEKGEICAFWRHRVKEIHASSVVLQSEDDGSCTELPNDFVLAMTGWRANHRLLCSLGVAIDLETAIPAHDPTTMRTAVPGVYIAGVIAAGHDANKIFIENGREHGALIVNDYLSGPISARSGS